jgi:Fe-S-cluster formation regulator IscX/YfhJ
MKIRAVGAELFVSCGLTHTHTNTNPHTHTDGRTDMTMLIMALANFANAPKKCGKN